MLDTWGYAPFFALSERDRYMLAGDEPVPVALISPTYAPDLRALCSCRGCSPVVTDDGRRPRIPTYANDPGSSALPMRTRHQRGRFAHLTDTETGVLRTESERPTVRLYRCRRCHEHGHNARTCKG